MKKKNIWGIIAGIATSAITVTAQESDIENLREELASVSARLAELESNDSISEKSDWTSSIKIKGDLRYRYEFITVDDETSKNRQRIRARIGAYADVNDFTTAGIRLRTGGTANSGNSTIGSDWDNKSIYLDLAYMSFALADGKYGNLTLGKMKYPWHVGSGMIWDGDVNPEGAAYTYDSDLSDTATFFGSAGGFKVREDNGTHDLNLISAQIGLKQQLSDSTKLTVGGSLFAYDNAEASYGTDYKIGEAFSDVTFSDLLPVPLKLYGTYINNMFEEDDNQGASFGIKFGDTKKGKWEATIAYRRLEAHAAPGAYADSDFVGGGNGVQGVRIKTAYNIAKHLKIGVAAVSGEKIATGSDVNTVHLDLSVSF